MGREAHRLHVPVERHFLRTLEEGASQETEKHGTGEELSEYIYTNTCIWTLHH